LASTHSSRLRAAYSVGSRFAPLAHFADARDAPRCPEDSRTRWSQDGDRGRHRRASSLAVTIIFADSRAWLSHDATPLCVMLRPTPEQRGSSRVRNGDRAARRPALHSSVLGNLYVINNCHGRAQETKISQPTSSAEHVAGWSTPEAPGRLFRWWFRERNGREIKQDLPGRCSGSLAATPDRGSSWWALRGSACGVRYQRIT
jgi:hypothetical protein